MSSTRTETPLRFAVLGSPVGHSKSPGMHAAAYRALGLPHAYERLETADAELPARVDALRRGDYAGFNVTVPHKTRVLAFVDELDASAASAGAANTLVRTSAGRIRAYNTDIPALAGELVRLAGGASDVFRGQTGLVLGTGGAARAAIVALVAHLGVARVVVRGRSLGDRSRCVAFEADVQPLLAGAASLTLEDLAAPAHEDPRLCAIVQATSCGMVGAAKGELVADAVAWGTVPARGVALDVVYAPPLTPLLARAKERGLACDNGLGMLARQGALAFEAWLGLPPPFEVMLAALEASAS